jgi:hypothetical protein
MTMTLTPTKPVRRVKLKKLTVKLTPEQWDEVETFYKSGDYTIKSIADHFGIAEVTIKVKAYNNKWRLGSMRTGLTKIAQTTITKIDKLSGGNMKKAEVLTQLLHTKLELSNTATKIVATSLNIQDKIVKGVEEKLSAGMITEVEAAKTLQSLGLNFNVLRELMGLTPVANEDNLVTINVKAKKPRSATQIELAPTNLTSKELSEHYEGFRKSCIVIGDESDTDNVIEDDEL